MATLRSLAVGVAVCMAAVACSSTQQATLTEPDSPAQSTERRCSPCATGSVAETIQSVVERELNNSVVPGVVVAVSDAVGLRHIEGFGMQDLDEGRPMPVDAVFGIGSVHKTFKWMVILQLVEQELISLDDPVGRYIDTPVLAGATIRDVLMHSTGMPDIVDVEGFMTDAVGDKERAFNRQQMFAYLDGASGQNSFGSFSDGALEGFSVGNDVSYSSFGPLVAGAIAEEVTGTPMQELIETMIFAELGLSNTSHMGVRPDPANLVPGYADATTINPFITKSEHTLAFSTANGLAVHSTGADLLRYAEGIFVINDVVSEVMLDEMLAEPRQGPGLKSGAGLIQFDAWAARDWWGHAGYGIRSHSTTMLHNREHQITVVVLSNIDTAADSYALNESVSDALLDALT